MKFKNIKKQEKVNHRKSPSNSRTIPAKSIRSKLSLPKINPAELFRLRGEALKIFVILIFMLTAILVGVDFRNNLRAKQEIDSRRGTLVKNLNFWKDFISKHENYKDAYFQASILEYRLGDTPKARMYAEKGLTLDPNSQDGEKIKQFLEGK
jgi:hypothetical protein